MKTYLLDDYMGSGVEPRGVETFPTLAAARNRLRERHGTLGRRIALIDDGVFGTPVESRENGSADGWATIYRQACATRSVLDFCGSRIQLEASHLGGDVPVTLGVLYRPHPEGKGRERVEFCRGKSGSDWFIWSVTRQQRIASFGTRRELEAAWADWH